MGEDDRRRLRENYQLLVDDMMDVPHIEGYLRRAEILSASALDYVLYPNTCHKRIKRLLKTLPFCGSRALPEFKSALMESSQTHLSLALAGKLALQNAKQFFNLKFWPCVVPDGLPVHCVNHTYK